MAFDAASSDDGRSETDLLVSMLTQRLGSLSQTITLLEKLVPQLGSPADGPALRQRLAAAETKADTLRGDIDSGSRRLRVESVGGSSTVPKSAERILQQFSDARLRLLDVLRASQSRQQKFPLPCVSAAESWGAASPRSPGGAGRRENPQDAIELSAIRPLDDVDEAIMEVRATAAAPRHHPHFCTCR